MENLSYMINRKIKNKTFFLILFIIFQLTIFWLGRFSVQISYLDIAQEVKKKNIKNSYNLSKVIKLEKIKLPSTYLMIIIISTPKNFEKRNAIRQTWLKLSTKTPKMFRYVFSIGAKNLTAGQLLDLENERKSYSSDILLLNNIEESYSKLTRKTAASIQYSVKNFNFKFLLKVDDDSFVRLGSFLQALQDISHPRLYWGFLDGRAKPYQKGKWKEKTWILCDRYLPYQLGGGYVISWSLANFISNSYSLLNFYHNEDVSVGAWLAGLDVKYLHDPRFDTEYTSRGCHNGYLITHKQSTKTMQDLFENIQKNGLLCTKEVRLRPSYIYDFSVPPSLCCVRSNKSQVP